LAPEQQRELVAYIISLQTERDAHFKDRLAAKIDDSDPAHWVELDELKRKLAD
jgi:hypothetical protein